MTSQPHTRDHLATLLWLDSDQRAARARLRRTLHRLGEVAAERRELEDGYAFRFAPEQFDQVTTFVGNECRCWPFLRFDLIVKPGGGPLTLRMRGRAGVRCGSASSLGQ